MDSKSYEWMKVGVMYDAYYELGGKCLIKKAAEDETLGLVTAEMPNGDLKRRHFAFFKLLTEASRQTFRFS